jgi:transcriptional regulator with XRE-family HTH domain
MTKRATKTKLEIATGKLLRQYREARGLTQRELATKLPGNTNQSIIADLESAEYRLHGQMIVDLCKVLKVSSDELLGIKPAVSLVKEPELLKRLLKLNKLSKRDREMLVQVMDVYLK